MLLPVLTLVSQAHHMLVLLGNQMEHKIMNTSTTKRSTYRACFDVGTGAGSRRVRDFEATCHSDATKQAKEWALLQPVNYRFEGWTLEYVIAI